MNRSKSRRADARSFVLIAVLGALAFPSVARKADRQQPMDAEADRVDASSADGEATLIGNVMITQGSLKITADKAVVRQNDQQELARAVLDGAPATMAQDLDGGGRMNARARNIDYDSTGGIVVLTGGVEIAQPRGTIRGERVTYDLNTQQVTGGGEGSPGRVQLRINPKSPGTASPPAETPPTEAPKQ